MMRSIARATNRVVLRIAAIIYGMGSGRECNLCRWQGRAFLSTGRGEKHRSDALCPRCRSVERHRLAHLLLRDRLPVGGRTLHVAPEPSVADWLRSISDRYLSVDLNGSRAMEAMDLTALSLPDASVTLVYASHVLEHIPDDRAAITEIRRVLAPDGIAVIQVPIGGGQTVEDLTVTNPDERLRRFGQRDHVRLYGLDLVGRLEDGGLYVETLDDSAVPPQLVERHRLVWRSTRQVFVCRPRDGASFYRADL